jgi:fucose permease|tara:strand:- start:1574 stop:2797 length:1224 start_codon:yes stop_codon:yes gene_type:complete
MKNVSIKLSLYVNYFVFAILLNSVGIVILKSQNVYGVGEIEASILEAYKDLPIAIVSFLIASFLPRIGYKKSMLISLALVTLACVYMFFGNSFFAAKVLFASVGAAFALIKVSVYTCIGLVTSNEKEHSSLMSSIEGVFMFGIALAYFLFPAFNTEGIPDAWLNVYWVLSGLSLFSFVLLLFIKFDEGAEIPGSNLLDDVRQMFTLIARLLVIVFVISAFLFVMLEQGIMTWLPTFNNDVLNVSENVAIMMASIFAVSLGVGRLIAGFLSKHYSWFYIVGGCILLAIVMVVFVLPKTIEVGINENVIENLSSVPLLAFAFPLVGFFISPIYPLLNSTVLSALPKKLHSPMTGLIIVFSALGGTLGSRAMGWLFKQVGPASGFYYTLIPIVLLLLTLILLKRLTQRVN